MARTRFLFTFFSQSQWIYELYTRLLLCARSRHRTAATIIVIVVIVESLSSSSSDVRYYIYIFYGYFLFLFCFVLSMLIFLGYNLCVRCCRHAYVFNNRNTDQIKYRNRFSLAANDRFTWKFCKSMIKAVQMRWRSGKFNALPHSLMLHK